MLVYISHFSLSNFYSFYGCCHRCTLCWAARTPAPIIWKCLCFCQLLLPFPTMILINTNVFDKSMPVVDVRFISRLYVVLKVLVFMALDIQYCIAPKNVCNPFRKCPCSFYHVNSVTALKATGRLMQLVIKCIKMLKMPPMEHFFHCSCMQLKWCIYLSATTSFHLPEDQTFDIIAFFVKCIKTYKSRALSGHFLIQLTTCISGRF